MLQKLRFELDIIRPVDSVEQEGVSTHPVPCFVHIVAVASDILHSARPVSKIEQAENGSKLDEREDMREHFAHSPVHVCTLG